MIASIAARAHELMLRATGRWTPQAKWDVQHARGKWDYLGRLDERAGRIDRERAGQRPRRARRVEMLGGIALQLAFAHEVPVEPAQGRESTRDARRREPTRAQPFEPADDVVGGDARGGQPARVEKAMEVVEIPAVRRESISGGSALALESPEILGDRRH